MRTTLLVAKTFLMAIFILSPSGSASAQQSVLGCMLQHAPGPAQDNCIASVQNGGAGTFRGGQPQDLIRVFVPWNPVQQPQSFGDLLLDCADNLKCRNFADVLGVTVGLPPGTITGAIETFEGLGGSFEGRRKSEEFRTDTFAPNGYRICDVAVRMVSAAPMWHNRAPTFAATVQSDFHFELYSFVHVQQLPKGRSWVEAAASVQFARIGSAAERNCHVQRGGVYQYRCNQRQYQGMPICGNVPWRSIQRVR